MAGTTRPSAFGAHTAPQAEDARLARQPVSVTMRTTKQRLTVLPFTTVPGALAGRRTDERYRSEAPRVGRVLFLHALAAFRADA